VNPGIVLLHPSIVNPHSSIELIHDLSIDLKLAAVVGFSFAHVSQFTAFFPLPMKVECWVAKVLLAPAVHASELYGHDNKNGTHTSEVRIELHNQSTLRW